MKIAICGYSGFLGQTLIRSFSAKGWEIVNIKRADLERNTDIISAVIDGCDAVINLAGAPIIKRWTKKHKKLIYKSRIETTRKITEAMKSVKIIPRIFISTSATGIYPDHNEHTENNYTIADDFIGHLCTDWENEARKASDFTRVVIFRTGLVLSRHGGALKKMIPIFKLGLGGPIGNGKQSFSWIHINDLIMAYHYVINNEDLSGTFNLTAPHYITNRKFVQVLARALKRPAVIPVPPLVLKLLYGEGSVTLIKGQAVIPERLNKSGFEFSYPTIQEAIAEIVRS